MTPTRQTPDSVPTGTARVFYLLFALSGAAGLIYQVLWIRAFTAVFGATAEAAAAILAAFFLGLAVGSDLFGRLADRIARPLRLYALLELGIAIAVLPALGGVALYRALYDELYTALSGHPFLFALLKMALTAAALLPATALMGGTLPALGRALTRDTGSLGQRGGRLYSANIIGAVSGVLVAAFGLPLWLGIRGAYAAAIVINLAVAAVAATLARHEPRLEPAPARSSRVAEGASEEKRRSHRLLAIAFASGFATIALELLWTRALALVIQNTVYSFGAVVAVFLMGLAGGAILVAWLLGRFPAWRVLRVSLLVTSPLIALGPIVLRSLTHGLEPLATPAGWPGYLVPVMGLSAAVVLLPVMSAGMTLPCVWELWRERPGAGSRLGRPTAVNTLGAILGPGVAGFAALPLLGLGGSLAAIAILYLLLGELAVPAGDRPRAGGWERAVVLPAFIIIAIAAPPTSLPLARTAPGEEVLWSEEGARGAVAVVERHGDRRIKLDNHYAIGGSQVAVEERRQGHLPILLHPRPRSVAFIGLGTGITAGAALAHPEVERVVAMELVPEIIDAARLYFGPWNVGVIDDPRVEVVVEDGRNHLAGTEERFDVIVGDLFVPWREGVGALYTREHFENVRARLEPGGIFAQWLPLWQLSRREFDIIAATFMSVFDHVSVWRGVFSPMGASVALVAHDDGRPVHLPDLSARIERLEARDPFDDGFLSELTGFMVLYAGDLSGQTERLARAGLNTENRPRIEWLAPRTLQEVERGERSWLTGTGLAELYAEINRFDDLPADRLLVGGARPPSTYRLAGADFYSAEVLAAAGMEERARSLRMRARRLLSGGR